MSSDSRPAPSLLEQAPKLYPPTSNSSRTASPVRRALHERSQSQTNQYPGPTIRVVKDTEDDVYLKFPTPSEPSQILPPPRHAPGYGFEKPGSRVSSGSQVASTIAKFESSHTAHPQQPLLGLQRKKKFRHSASTRTSDADTLVASTFSPSSIRFSQGSTPPSSPPPEPYEFEKGLEILQEESSSRSQRPTIRAVPPSSSGGESLESRKRALTPKASAASFAPSHPDGSPTLISNAGNPSSVSASRPLPKPHIYSPASEAEKGEPTSAGDTDHRHPTSKPSIESFAYSDISYTVIEPSYTATPPPQPSPTLHEARTATLVSGTRVHYPIVRAPSASSLRAESLVVPNIASRMQDRSLVHQWSSQLSTIQSISERDSRSIARGSRSFGARSHSQDSYLGSARSPTPRGRGQTIGSAQSSSDNVSEGQTEFSVLPPRPLFSPVSRDSSEERDYHSEHLDTISPLPSSGPLRKMNSGYLRRHASDAGSTDSRPGSSQSDLSTFIHNTIPAWARAYYRRGERISMGAPESESSGSLRLGTSHSGRSHTPSETNFPLSIYRPRNRPRNRTSQADTIDYEDEILPIEGDIYVINPNMPPLSGWSTPHLQTTRRGQTAYSAWKAPSLDDDLNRTLFGRQNRQVLLFCIGFIFPLAWMIASFLPLPLDPNLANTPSQADMEQRFAQAFGPADDKAFQKATWWRNLNRIMSGIGTLLIGVIIALAILASRMAA